jgi:hypothetical protein
VRARAQFSASLRRELSERQAALAIDDNVRRFETPGGVSIFCAAPDGKSHGNFATASYRAILKRPAWAARLRKVHTAKRRGLPAHPDCGTWYELDSCMSSDALMMNIFCYPGVCARPAVAGMLGVAPGSAPEFGFRARVPLERNLLDRTEIDMRLGDLLVEAKLTESDFQTQRAEVVRRYRDLELVFEVERLARQNGRFAAYQLIRNVLAAHASSAAFCVMADERRPDLIEMAGELFACVRDADLRTRCKLLTWQELAPALPSGLRRFLSDHYGIRGRGLKPTLRQRGAVE